jgi:hypothetical protein
MQEHSVTSARFAVRAEIQLAESVKSSYNLHLTLGVDIITVGGAHQVFPRVEGRAILV